MLIKTITELVKYVRISEVSNFDSSFKPFIEETEQKYILKYLGQDQLDELQVYYDAELTNVPALNSLLEYAQRALAKFVLKAAAPFLDLEISEGGFTVNSTNTAAPASVNRVKNLLAETESQGWDSLELMLKYLEQNEDSFPLWAASDAYTLQRSTLIQSAAEFDQYLTIKESRLWFFQNKSLMRDVENSEIKTKISTDLYDTLLSEINAGSVSTANEAILGNIKRAITHFTYARSLVLNKLDNEKLQYKPTIDLQAVLEYDKQQIEKMAEFYLNKAINTILDDLDSYPDYENSDLYDEDFESFENEQENGIFKAGGA